MIHHDNFVKLLDVFSEGERLLVLVVCIQWCPVSWVEASCVV